MAVHFCSDSTKRSCRPPWLSRIPFSDACAATSLSRILRIMKRPTTLETRLLAWSRFSFPFSCWMKSAVAARLCIVASRLADSRMRYALSSSDFCRACCSASSAILARRSSDVAFSASSAWAARIASSCDWCARRLSYFSRRAAAWTRSSFSSTRSCSQSLIARSRSSLRSTSWDLRSRTWASKPCMNSSRSFRAAVVSARSASIACFVDAISSRSRW
mmetsp:Transcript_7166/g.18663  ORF Transcript_7166/g.18663 Transcript_7166/m.18663 type:complete len:218 (-) Transcript_7166:530-1183(-)